MKRAMTLVTVGAVLIAAAAFAQQPPQQQTPPPAATQKPATPAPPAPPPAKPFPEGFKLGFIDVQRIASESLNHLQKEISQLTE